MISFFGLCDKSKAYLEENALKRPSGCAECAECAETIEVETLNPVWGSFGETLYYLKRYTHKGGSKFEEYVQYEDWQQGGPYIFTALRWTDNEKIISRWTWEEIQGQLKYNL